MATIERRRTKGGKLRYRVLIRLKGRPASSKTFARLTDAKDHATKEESAVKENRDFPERSERQRTLGELIDAYVANRKQEGRYDPKRAKQLEWWKAQLGPYTLDAVRGEIQKALAGLADGSTSPSGRPITPVTRKRYLAALSHVFTIAIRVLGLARSNPVRDIVKPPEPKGRVRFLSRDDELPRLLAACRKSRDRRLHPMVVLALATGARRGELMSLRWADVDLERGIAVLHKTKNDERRALSLAAPALDALAELRRVRFVGSDFVFASLASGSRVPKFPRKAWDTALRRAEIADFHWHDLRHTAASYLAMSGATLLEIAAVLGHKTLAMVKRYSHLSDAHVRGVVSRMADSFLAGTNGAPTNSQ